MRPAFGRASLERVELDPDRTLYELTGFILQGTLGFEIYQSDNWTADIHWSVASTHYERDNDRRSSTLALGLTWY